MSKPKDFWIRPARNYSEPVVLPFDAEVLLPDTIHVREVRPEVDAALEALIARLNVLGDAMPPNAISMHIQKALHVYSRAIISPAPR